MSLFTISLPRLRLTLYISLLSLLMDNDINNEETITLLENEIATVEYEVRLIHRGTSQFLMTS